MKEAITEQEDTKINCGGNVGEECALQSTPLLCQEKVRKAIENEWRNRHAERKNGELTDAKSAAAGIGAQEQTQTGDDLDDTVQQSGCQGDYLESRREGWGNGFCFHKFLIIIVAYMVF